MSNVRFASPSALPPVIKNLIIINVLVWVAQLIFEQNYHLTYRIGLWPVQSAEFHPYQVATHMFAHATYDSQGDIYFSHILFNMISLWMFGRELEYMWGPKRFLFFYLACGIGAAALHMIVQYFQFQAAAEYVYSHPFQFPTSEEASRYVYSHVSMVVGASGAITGVIVASAYTFPNALIFMPIPIKAKWAAIIMIGTDLFLGFNPTPGDNIAHFVHLGGALVGFILVLIWNKTNRRTLY